MSDTSVNYFKNIVLYIPEISWNVPTNLSSDCHLQVGNFFASLKPVASADWPSGHEVQTSCHCIYTNIYGLLLLFVFENYN